LAGLFVLEESMATPLFDLGQIVGTPGALEAIQKANQQPLEFLQRHVAGDWGDLDAEDKEANDGSLEDGTRIFSAYHTVDEVKIWIITEWDRSATTLLLPSEY
jgi:hypothetical protein